MYHIYKAYGGQSYGFVKFSKEEVGRSLLGQVHNVEGVQLRIDRAKPDMLTVRNREDRGGRHAVRTRSEVCAFFREGRCLRGNHCEFQHIGESPRTSQEFWQDDSCEKQRSRRTSEEELWVHGSTDGIKANNLHNEGSSPSSLHLTGPIERDGRLRPPPSTKEKKRRVSFQVSPVCKFPSHEEHPEEEVVEETVQASSTKIMRGPGVAQGRNNSDTDNMGKDAMAIRRREKEGEEKEVQEDTVPTVSGKTKRKLRGLILLTMAKKIRQLEKDEVEKMASLRRLEAH